MSTGHGPLNRRLDWNTWAPFGYVGLMVTATIGFGPRVTADSIAPRGSFVVERTVSPTLTGLTAPFRLSGNGGDTIVALDSGNGVVATIDLTTDSVSLWSEQTKPEDIDGIWKDWGAIDVAGPIDGGFIVQRRYGRILHHGGNGQGLNLLARISADGSEMWSSSSLPVRDPSGDIAHPDRLWTQDITLARDGSRLFLLDRGVPSIGAASADHGGSESRMHYLPPATARRVQYEFGWYVDLEEMPDGRIAVLDQVTNEIRLIRSPWSPQRE